MHEGKAAFTAGKLHFDICHVIAAKCCIRIRFSLATSTSTRTRVGPINPICRVESSRGESTWVELSCDVDSRSPDPTRSCHSNLRPSVCLFVSSVCLSLYPFVSHLAQLPPSSPSPLPSSPFLLGRQLKGIIQFRIRLASTMIVQIEFAISRCAEQQKEWKLCKIVKNCEKLRKLNTHKTNNGEQFELCKTIEGDRGGEENLAGKRNLLRNSPSSQNKATVASIEGTCD